MSGFRTLAGKELRESVVTGRWLIAPAVFMLSGLGAIVLTYYLPDLVRTQAGSGIAITIPRQTAADGVVAYAKDMDQLPALALILLSMGGIAEERARGVAALILSRPGSASAYVLAKFTAQGLVVLLSLSAAALGSFGYMALLFRSAPVGPFLLINLGLLVMLLDVVGLTLLASAALGSGVAAGGVALVAYIALSSLPGFWAPLNNSLPTGVTGRATVLAAGSWGGAAAVQPLLGGLALALVCFLLAAMAVRLRPA
jgi:ABC-type transport system involved in multi-copper enzyme maturation permease subunit